MTRTDREQWLRPDDPTACEAHLTEEAGELVAALGKTARWGPKGTDPTLPEAARETNADWVLRELEDVLDAAARWLPHADPIIRDRERLARLKRRIGDGRDQGEGPDGGESRGGPD